MHKYEFAHIIVSEGKKDEEIQEVIGNVRQIIGELGGRIVKEDVWGQKELAYEIEKQNHGFYMFTIVMMDPAKVPELEKKMKLVEGSMRYMIINLDREPGYEDDLNIAIEKESVEEKEETKSVEEKEEEKPAEEKKESKEVVEKEEEKEEEVEKEEEEPKEEVEEKKEEEKPAEEKKESKEDLDKLIDEKLNELL